jgi:hypothetical protein
VAVADALVVPVTFLVDRNGAVADRPVLKRDYAFDPAAAAAARRALDAVHAGAPYGQAFRGQAITVRFDAKSACSVR